MTLTVSVFAWICILQCGLLERNDGDGRGDKKADKWVAEGRIKDWSKGPKADWER